MLATRHLGLWLAVSTIVVGFCLPAFAAGDDNKLQKIARLVEWSEDTRGELDRAHRKLETALEHLDAFRNSGDEDAKKAYGKFKNGAEEFRKQSTDGQERIWKLRKDVETFFADWEAKEASMTSDRRKTRSQNRRAAARAAMDRQLAAFAEVEDVFGPTVADMMEMATRMKDNYGIRNDASVSEMHERVKRLSDDIYWQLDNAIAKTEVFR